MNSKAGTLPASVNLEREEGGEGTSWRAGSPIFEKQRQSPSHWHNRSTLPTPTPGGRPSARALAAPSPLYTSASLLKACGNHACALYPLPSRSP